MDNELFKDRIDVQSIAETIANLKLEISKVIVGQEKLINNLIIAILSDGHVLLEGVPGIAKTLSIKLLAKSISTGFSRIQFTPDLMPSDVTGSSIFNNSSSKFEFKKGPVFSNIILIDEINRAPAKTQSALFEVMEERQVTVDGKTYKMDQLFLVFATQNPLEHEGTYRLPEAQLDRFMFKINVDYPSVVEEQIILSNFQERKEVKEIEIINPVISVKEILHIQHKVKHVHIDNNIIKYITEIVSKTRNHPALYLGASPRASIYAMCAGRANAVMNGRDFVTPEDIKDVIYPILNHRIYLTPERELEGGTEEQIISEILKKVEVPR